MKGRTVILILLVFFSVLILSFPMRGLISLLDDQNSIKTQTIEGFWWKSNLQKVVIGNRQLGDIYLNFLPSSLVQGKFEFYTEISGKEIDLKGYIGMTFLGNVFFREVHFYANPVIQIQSGKPVFQNISNVRADVPYLYFNKDGCLRAKGKGTGEIVDMFGLFSRNLNINIAMKCRAELLELSFESMPQGLLEGEVLIDNNLEFKLEARSKRLSSKIREISKLNFEKDPSLKVSGNLEDLLNNF